MFCHAVRSPSRLGSRKAKISPSSTSNETSLTAVKEPKVFTRLRTRIIEEGTSVPETAGFCDNGIISGSSDQRKPELETSKPQKQPQILRLRLAQSRAPNSAQDDNFE